MTVSRFISITVTLALLAAGQAACVSTSKKREELRLKNKAAKKISMEDLTGNGQGPDTIAPKGKPAKAGAKTTTPPPKVDHLKQCQDLVTRYSLPLLALYKRMPTGVYAPTGGALDVATNANVAQCVDQSQQATIIRAVAAAINEHGGRIGFVLPVSGERARPATALLNGVKAALGDMGVNFDQVAILKDSGGTVAGLEARLAELVFKDKVSLVVGGMDQAEAEALARWSAALSLPTLLVTREREITLKSPYVFRVYPDEKRLAGTLADAADRRAYRRIAVLRPTGGKADKVTEYFKSAATAHGATIVFDLTYTPGNFESMQGVAQQLFQTDASLRADEYRLAYRKARQRAQAEGVAFDPRMVLLKPIINFDAVFLPDDFRSVRHMVKLFKFHMVDHLPVIGNHEWRSPALINPPEDFLDGSIFGDFVGSYAKLPASLGAQTTDSPYFVLPEQVGALDFGYIGYRVGRAARLGTQNAATISRRRIAGVLAGAQSDGTGAFPRGPIFDRERQVNWPTYLFKLDGPSLVLESEDSLPAASAAIPAPGSTVPAVPVLTGSPKGASTFYGTRIQPVYQRR